MKKCSGVAVLIAVTGLMMAGCSSNLQESVVENMPVQIPVGDEVIYGQEFSLQNVYMKNARDLGIEDEVETQKMIYFSVCPSTVDSVKNINEVLGAINPYELNKVIEQTCDSDVLLYNTDVEISENTPEEDIVKTDVPYYYILSEDEFEAKKNLLENVKIIEEFEQPVEPDAENDAYENLPSENCRNARWLFDSWFPKYNIVVNVKYNVSLTDFAGSSNYIGLSGKGVKLRAGLWGNNVQTDNSGSAYLGSYTNIGLQWIYITYENDACRISDVLGLVSGTLIGCNIASNLTNWTYNPGSSFYDAAKISICSELLTRREAEMKLHPDCNIPQAKVWPMDFNFTSACSTPAFNLRGNAASFDILLMDASRFATYSGLFVLHHEYSHYLHLCYTNNKDDFWNGVVSSEIDSMVSINDYDFSNDYVNFTENLAAWEEMVGLTKGNLGNAVLSDYNLMNEVETSGYRFNSSGNWFYNITYINSMLFYELVNMKSSLLNEETVLEQGPDEVYNLIDEHDIITFQEFYDRIIERYPEKKNLINYIFKTYYKNGGKLVYAE